MTEKVTVTIQLELGQTKFDFNESERKELEYRLERYFVDFTGWNIGRLDIDIEDGDQDDS